MSGMQSRLVEHHTSGEALFEAYLRKHELSWSREGKYVRPENAKKWLDFEVRVGGEMAYCEIKDFHARSGRPVGAAMFDPYGHIRKAIEKAREQFRDYRSACCVLVLHNVDDWEFRDRPYILFGAMLGDAGVSIAVSVKSGKLARSATRSMFLRNGKMLAPNRREPRNTTISAIAVVSEYTVPNPEFEAEYRRRVLAIPASIRGRARAVQRLDTRLALYDEMPVTLDTVPRICAFENPFAAVRLPGSLFKGPYDAVFRLDAAAGCIQRCYAGPGLLRDERLEAARDVFAKIDRFAQAVVRRFKPERIVLFGSHANGTARPGSDADLLVVFPGDGDESHRSLEIRRCCNPDFAMDLLTRSAGEVRRRLACGDAFFRDIMDRGMVLYATRCG